MILLHFKLSQEELKEAKANTKWAYILSTDETLLQKLDYRKITQEGSDSPYIGEDYTLTLKKEYFDINKATYLHIFAYINAPSSKVKQVLKLEYPLSLRFNGKELHIVEWALTLLCLLWRSLGRITRNSTTKARRQWSTC